jgi:ribosomal protein L5
MHSIIRSVHASNSIEFITTFSYKNVYNIINLKQLTLHIHISEYNPDKLVVFYSFLLLITNQKPCGIKSKKLKLTLSFKKGIPIGCKVNLRKDQMFLFLDSFLLHCLGPLLHTKKCHVLLNKNNYRLSLNDLFVFNETNKKYLLFAHLNNLTIDFLFYSPSLPQIITFATFLKLPI